MEKTYPGVEGMAVDSVSGQQILRSAVMCLRHLVLASVIEVFGTLIERVKEIEDMFFG